MHYNFVEIGAANFNTCYNIAQETSHGIVIEPVADHLASLPNLPFVKKLNLGISADNTLRKSNIFYVPEHIVNSNNLPYWLKGCNSIGDYHFQHNQLKIHHLVQRDPVDLIPIGELWRSHNITSLDLLKIDTEGSDSDILLHLADWLMTQPDSAWPRIIQFETNELSEANKIQQVIDFYRTKNYYGEISWPNTRLVRIQNTLSKVSFVCTTYRRFTCVERIVAQFHAQTYPNKQLIIFNTDTEHPYSLGFEDANIVVVNNSINYETGNPYQNRGEICRDAVTHANGDYFMLADDDDVYLPWHIQQAVEGIKSTGHHAWKPEKSLFAMPGKIEFCQNTLEASVIVQMNRIREIGFRMDITGYEGLSWYTQLRNEGQLDEHNKNYVPSYVFNWSDPHDIAGHKQSGAIGSPNNFEEHKIQSRDFAQRPLQKLNPDVIQAFYKPFIVFLNTNKNSLNYDYFMRYVSTHSEEF